MHAAPHTGPSRRHLTDLAHELRQSLGSLDAVAYYLNLIVPPEDARVREQVGRLRPLVEQANWSLTCALELSNPDPLDLHLANLNDLVSHILTSRRSTIGSLATLGLGEDLARVQLDFRRARTMLESLLFLASLYLEDALAAVADEGNPLPSLASGPPPSSEPLANLAQPANLTQPIWTNQPNTAQPGIIHVEPHAVPSGVLLVIHAIPALAVGSHGNLGPGSHLILASAARIAGLHGGQFSHSMGPHGARFDIEFPAFAPGQ